MAKFLSEKVLDLSSNKVSSFYIMKAKVLLREIKEYKK